MDVQIINVRNAHAKEKVCSWCGQTFRPNMVTRWPWKRGARGKIYCSRKCMKEALEGGAKPCH